MALNLGGLGANLTLNIQNFVQGIQRATQVTRYFGQQLNTAIGNQTSNLLLQLAGHNRQVASSFSEIRRIVSGIVISQAFYAASHAIQDAFMSVQRFSAELEVAQASFERLLGSAERAKGFIAVLEDFAALTPYTTQQTFEISRRMLAMGFAANSLKSVMTIITDATAALGGGDLRLERIVLAIGQIKTNGKLAGQEIRQLGEAGIDARKILKEELGLTADQLMNIGKLGIQGDVAVQAILTGLEKRFKGMNEVIANTTTGMLATIRDDILLISADLNTNFFQFISGGIRFLRDNLEILRKALREGGFASVFKNLIPPEMQNSIKAIILAFQLLGKSVKTVFLGVASIFGDLAATLVRALGLILPPIAYIVDGFISLSAWAIKSIPPLRWFAQAVVALTVANLAAKAILLLWRVMGLAKVATIAGAAVLYLAKALQSLLLVLFRNPWTALLTILAAVLLTLALRSKFVADMFDKLSASTAKLFGYNLDDALGVSKVGNYDKVMKQFNERLKGLGGNFKDVGKEAEKTAKKVKDKFIASFDEVFNIPDMLDTTADSLVDIEDTFPEVTMPDLTDFATEVPDLGGGFSLPDLNLEGMWTATKEMLSNIGESLRKFFFEDAPKFLKPFFYETLPAFLKKVPGWFVEAFRKIDSVLSTGSWAEPIKNTLDGLRDWIKLWAPEAIWPFVDVATEMGKSFVDFFAAVTAGLYNTSKQALQYVGEALMLFWKNYGDDVIGIATNSWALIVEVAKLAWEELAPTLQLIKDVVGGAVEIIKWLFEEVYFTALVLGDMLKLFWDTWGKDIIGIFKEVWNIIKGVLDEIWKRIVSIFEQLKVFWDSWGVSITAVFTFIWELLKTTVKSALEAILLVIGSTLRIINNVIQLALNILKGDWSAAWENLKTIVRTVWEAIKGLCTIGIKATKDTLGFFADAVAKIFLNIKDNIVGAFTGIWQTIKNELNYLISLVNKFTGKLGEIKIPSWIPGAGGTTLGIPPIPPLAAGGIVQKETIARIGEGNRKEAIIPMEGGAMGMIAEMIASQLEKVLNNGTRLAAAGDTNYYTIGTLIGDDRSLAELERRLGAVRVKDARRRGEM